MYENTLINDLKTVLTPMPGRNDAAVTLLVRTGSRDELDSGQEGAAAIITELLKRHLTQVNDSSLTVDGIQVHSESHRDYSSISLYGPLDKLSPMLNMTASALKEFAVKTQDAQEVRAWLAVSRTDKGGDCVDPVKKDILKRFFGDHPYSRIPALPAGHTGSSREYVRTLQSMYERNFRPENSLLFVSGGFSQTGAVTEKIRKSFEPWPVGYKPRILPGMPEQPSAAANFIYHSADLPTEACITVAWKFPGLASGSRDAAALSLVSSYLFSPYSPLAEYLCDNAGVLVGIRTNFEPGRDAVLLTVNFDLYKAEDLDFAESYIRRYFKGRSREIQPAAVQRLLEKQNNQDQGMYESPLSFNHALLQISSVNGDPKDPFLFFNQLKTVNMVSFNHLMEEIMDLDEALLYRSVREAVE